MMKEENRKVNVAVGKFFRMQRDKMKPKPRLYDVSEAMGMKRTWYSDIEYGRSTLSFPNAMKLCDYYGCDINDLRKFVDDHLNE